jgi:hypothetical protein
MALRLSVDAERPIVTANPAGFRRIDGLGIAEDR